MTLPNSGPRCLLETERPHAILTRRVGQREAWRGLEGSLRKILGALGDISLRHLAGPVWNLSVVLGGPRFTENLRGVSIIRSRPASPRGGRGAVPILPREPAAGRLWAAIRAQSGTVPALSA